jgi:hypothetical protein
MRPIAAAVPIQGGITAKSVPRAIFSVPPPNPVTCLMQSQAFLAETSVGNELDEDDRVKIVCVRREPVSAMK